MKKLSAKKAAAFERYKRIAEAKGGKLLTTEFVDSQTKMLWECAAHHTWDANGNSVQQGSWCPMCTGRVRSIEDLQRIAEERGGKCLSTEYEGIFAYYRWECADGHQWVAKADLVKHRTWCPRCARQSRYTIEHVQALAAKHRGECMSKEFTTIHAKYRFRCELGHVFTMTAHAVQQDHFCMRCRGRLPDTRARLERIAQRKGGRVLSDYINATTKIHLECRKQHRWWTMPHLIVKGHWCAICNRATGHSTAPLGLEVMRATARERGGECLSKAYVNLLTPMRWRCAFRHEWTATGASIRHGKSWCPDCAWRYPGTIDGMRRLAADRNGKCLSSECNSQQTTLLWECERRHRFETTAMAARSGLWCTRCKATGVNLSLTG